MSYNRFYFRSDNNSEMFVGLLGLTFWVTNHSKCIRGRGESIYTEHA